MAVHGGCDKYVTGLWPHHNAMNDKTDHFHLPSTRHTTISPRISQPVFCLRSQTSIRLFADKQSSAVFKQFSCFRILTFMW